MWYNKHDNRISQKGGRHTLKIEELSVDVYHEECVRAQKSELEIKDVEINEISLPKEFIQKIENHDFSEYDTLVGVMRSPRQFGICLKRKFYHIPALYVEEYPIPKYIALYQSQRMFGNEVSGVKYYGEVKKCIPMRRSKIREIPKESNELYYKFKVKSWNRLEKSLASGEVGFVRLFTSFFLLQNVEDISMLTTCDAYELSLYKLVKLADDEVNNEHNISWFSIDGFDVIFTNEIIYLCLNGKICERYYRSGIYESPSKVIRKMRKDIAKFTDDKEKKNEI